MAAKALRERLGNRWVIIGVGAAVFVIAGLIVWQVVSTSDSDANEAERGEFATASVEKRDLVEAEDFDGTLGYTDERTLTAPIAGTVRELPAEGSVVEPGAVLMRVDDDAVILLNGAEPAWRDLDTSTEGTDVRQLEENLIALGYADEGDLSVDDDYTAATANVVGDMQDALGIDDTGELTLGQVVFLPGAQRIASQAATVGDQVGPGSPVLAVTSADRDVVVQVPPEDIDLFTIDAPVSIELPDGADTPGRVTEIGQSLTVADPESGGDGVQEVRVTLDDPAAAGELVSAPVKISITKTTAENALAVPVQALIALAEGGYAVEVVGGDATTLVGVETGSFADGWVSITGDVDPGAEVVIPK